MTTSVQVKLEIGHKATLRDHVTEDGFTHDWTVFVRGEDGCNIHHFVEKVIFHLHRDFAKPKRVIKEPPFEVSESGYGSFMMTIVVYFKQKEEPKKVEFEYDLFLNIQHPVNHIRQEKLTFQNPTEDFMKKLMRAGAVVNHPDNGGISLNPHYQRPSTPNATSGTVSQSKDRKSTSLAIKAPKSSSSSSSNSRLKEPSSTPAQKIVDTSVKTAAPTPAPPNKSFVELFGQPISKTTNSPDPQKVKSSQSKKSSSSSHHQSKNSSSLPSKDIKNSSVKDPTKSQVKEKIFSKRSLSPLPGSPLEQSETKNRKRSSTESPSSTYGSSKPKDNRDTDKEKKSSSGKVKSSKNEKSSSGKSKEKSKESKSGKEGLPKPAKRIKLEGSITGSSPSLSTHSSIGSSSEVARSRETPQFTPTEPRNHYDGDMYGGGEESRSSTSSFSSMHQYKGSGPLGALMAELDNEDEQDDVLSPLSSDSSPSHSTSSRQDLPPPQSMLQDTVKSSSKHSHESKSSKHKSKEEKNKDSKSKKNHSNSGNNGLPNTTLTSVKSEPSEFQSVNKLSRPLQLEINEEYITELQELQKRIMLVKDRHHLQQIVNVIEETGKYQLTSTTFDFDLCSLDKGTVKKLQSCLSISM